MVEQERKRLLVHIAAFLVERNAYRKGKTAILGWAFGQLEKCPVRQAHRGSLQGKGDWDLVQNKEFAVR